MARGSAGPGLPNWRWFEKDAKLRINLEPPSRYSYSGEGLTFLQVVLEKRTGRSLEDLAQEKVFAPYGMTRSSYRWQPRFEANYCLGHTRFLGAVLRDQGLKASSWSELFATQSRVRSKRQFGPLAAENSPANDTIQLG